MSFYQRERFFWLIVGIMSILYTDVWAWDKLQPLLFGWIPYTMWYLTLLSLAAVVIFAWLGAWAWPEPPEGALKREARGEEKTHE